MQLLELPQRLLVLALRLFELLPLVQVFAERLALLYSLDALP